MNMFKQKEAWRTSDVIESKTTVSKFELYYAHYIKYEIQIILWHSEGTLTILYIITFSTYFRCCQAASELLRVFQALIVQNKGVGVERSNVHIPLMCYNI